MSSRGEMGDDALISGRFRLGELLGTGGTASVFDADDVLDGTRVALKILHPHLAHSAEACSTFAAEAQTAGVLSHPNIVRALASGVHETDEQRCVWIALQRADGITLAEYIEAHGALEVDDALTVAEGMLSALEAAHAAGIVHRDISPTNVMVYVSDESAGERSGRGHRIEPAGVRLLDFGLADIAGRTAHGAGVLGEGRATPHERTIVGNAHYLSPEHARGLPVTESSDLYHVAGVLYFALTARPPFPRATTAAVLEAHIQSPPPVPSVLNPSCSRSVDRIVVKGMLKSSASRFSSATDMLAAVQGARSSPMVRGAWPGENRMLAPRHTLSESDRTMVIPAGVAADPDALTTRLAQGRAGGPAPASVRGTTVRGAMLDRGHAAVAQKRTGAGRAGTGAGAFLLLVLVMAVVWAGAVTGDRPDDAALIASAGPSPSASTPASASTPTPTDSPSAVPLMVSVPELGTMTLKDALSTLASAGLVAGELSVENSAAPGDTVLGMSLLAGTSVAPGTTVGLAVASGSNVVPAVAGMTMTDAVAAVRGAGLDVAHSVSVAQGIPEGTVVQTQPAAGTELRLGTSVTIVTAEAQAPVSPAPPAPTAPSDPTTPRAPAARESSPRSSE